MAKYTGTYFSTARNKFGGLVLLPSSTTPTVRQRHIPIKPQALGHISQQAFVSAARQLWYSNPAEYTLGWAELASWLKYADGPDAGTYVPPFPTWLSAQSNARILATSISECTTPFPSPPNPIDALTLTTSDDGSCSAAAFSSGAALTTPWLLYLTQAAQQTIATAATAGGLALGGSLTGAAFDVATALRTATGKVPLAGRVYSLRAATLYPGSYVTAQSFAFQITTAG